jgi:hypothetical protein
MRSLIRPSDAPVFGRVVVLHAVAHLPCAIFQGDACRLVLAMLDLVLCAPAELTSALRGQDDEQVAIDTFEDFKDVNIIQTSMSGNLSLRRPVRQRSAWMMAAS